jgi:hypothetical protein
MPIPKPNPNESERDFMQRCMSDETMKREYDLNQRLAVCSTQYRQNFADTYNDYPKQASENAKIALRWAEENGWGDCGTPVGKQRANQLAKGEAISRETISRMKDTGKTQLRN